MKNILLIICIATVAASCEKYTCQDIAVHVEIEVEQPDSFLTYSITQYAKGTTNVVSTKEDTAKYKIKRIDPDIVNYDWKIEIHETGTVYTISNVHYKKEKGGRYFDMSAHYPECSNDTYYTLNGKEYCIGGDKWNHGVYSPPYIVITLTKDIKTSSRL